MLYLMSFTAPVKLGLLPKVNGGFHDLVVGVELSSTISPSISKEGSTTGPNTQCNLSGRSKDNSFWFFCP